MRKIVRVQLQWGSGPKEEVWNQQGEEEINRIWRWNDCSFIEKRLELLYSLTAQKIKWEIGGLGPRTEEANIDLDKLIGPTVLLMEGPELRRMIPF